MKHVKIITMALLAAFCLSAVAASSAFALSGEISTNLSKGVAPVKGGFTGKSAKEGFLETKGGSKITCTSTEVSGKVVSTTSGEATFVFNGCATAGLKCKTANTTTAGQIKIPVTLTGGAARVKNSKDEIENTVAETTITCSTVKVLVKGSVLIPAEPTGVLQTKYTFNAKGKAGVQEPDNVPVNAHLEANFAAKGFEAASISATGLEVTFEENVAAI